MWMDLREKRNFIIINTFTYCWIRIDAYQKEGAKKEGIFIAKGLIYIFCRVIKNIRKDLLQFTFKDLLKSPHLKQMKGKQSVNGNVGEYLFCSFIFHIISDAVDIVMDMEYLTENVCNNFIQEYYIIQGERYASSNCQIFKALLQMHFIAVDLQQSIHYSPRSICSNPSVAVHSWQEIPSGQILERKEFYYSRLCWFRIGAFLKDSEFPEGKII